MEGEESLFDCLSFYLDNWPMKPLSFMGNSQVTLAGFPEEVKRAVGFELWQVQLGLMPSDFKPMPTVGDIDLAAKRYQLIGINHVKTQK